MFLDKLSVGGRLRALSIFASLSCLSIGAVLVLGNVQQEKTRLKEFKAREGASQIQHLVNVSLELRRIENLAITERDLDRLNEFDIIASMTIENLRTIVEQRLDAGPLINEFEAYKDAVDTLMLHHQKLGLTENDGLQGSLRQSVHNAEKKLSDVENNALLVKMLMMRRHEKDFMMRVADKYISRLDQRVVEFKEILASELYSSEFKQDMLLLIETYQSEFKKWAQTRLEIFELNQAVDEYYDQLHSSLLNLSKKAEAETAKQVELGNKQRIGSLILVALLIIAISISLIIFTAVIGRSIQIPLRRMTKDMLDLSDLTDQIETLRGHEIRTMQKTLEIFRAHKQEAAELKEKQLISNRIAKENRIRERTQIVTELEQNLGTAIESLSVSSQNLSITSKTLQSNALQSDEEAQNASTSASQTSEATGAMSQASAELAASIDEILRQADQSQITGRKAVDDTQILHGSVSNLKGAVEEIVEVVSLIHNIAAQTNLLSLNATIEAARAGEAGKGFAVVAAEVKQLADQTSKSTVSVNERIQAIQTAVENASGSIDNVITHIKDMSGMANQIVTAVETQKQATDDIANRVGEATDRSRNVASTLNGLSSRVQETHEHAETLNDAADSLSQQAEALKKDTSEYIERLRIA